MKKTIKSLILLLVFFFLIGCNDTHSHEYKSVVYDPTCISDGYTEYLCECGDEYIDNYVDKLGHSFGEWITLSEPTIDLSGEKKRECSVCHEVEYDMIPKLDHEHIYQVVDVDPTCTEKGFTIHLCYCGYEYDDNFIEPLGHDFSEWLITIEPTEYIFGEKQRECSFCHEVETESINKLEHQHQYTETVIEATCMKAGYTTYTCTCGYEYTDNYIINGDHKYSEWVTTIEPTNDEDGIKTRECEYCHIIDTQFIEHNHEHKYYVQSEIQSTCSSLGYVIYRCNCGETYQEDSTTLLPHNYSNWYPTVIASDTPGTAEHYCYDCSFKEQKEYELIAPEYEIPTDIEATYLDVLGNITLPSGFSFTDSYYTLVGEVGIHYFTARYEAIGVDSWKYYAVEDIKIPVKVNPLDYELNVDFSKLDNLVFNGKQIEDIEFDKSLINIISIYYYQNDILLDSKPRNAGEYKIVIKTTNKNYADKELSYNFEIKKNLNLLDTIEITDQFMINKRVDFSYLFDETAQFIYSVNGNVLKNPPSEAGFYSVLIKLQETDNYAAQEKEFTFSIVEAEEYPVWDDEPYEILDNNTYKLNITNKDSFLTYIITLNDISWNVDPYLITTSNIIYLAESGIYYVYAVDRSGNKSETIGIVNYVYGEEEQYNPQNIYPQDKAIITTNYVELFAEGADILYLVDEDGGRSKIDEFQFSLGNNKTYYWAAEKGGVSSPVYSFTVKLDDVSFENIYPADGEYVEELEVKIKVNSTSNYVIYYGWDPERVITNYDTDSRFRYGITYYWYAEDENGNKTDVWSFIYMYGDSKTNTIDFENGETFEYVNDTTLILKAYSTVGIQYVQYLIIDKDGNCINNYSTSLAYNYYLADDKYDSYFIRNLVNGDTVYTFAVNSNYQESQVKIFKVDTENPINGAVLATYENKWNMDIKCGTDNIGAKYYYRINHGEWIEYSSDTIVDVNSLSCYVELKAIDFAGNVSYNEYYYQNQEYIFPTIEVVSGKLGEFINTDVVLKIIPVENVNCYYYIDDKRYELTEEITLTFTDEGEYKVYTVIETEEGEVCSNVSKVMIDITAPIFGDIYVPEVKFNTQYYTIGPTVSVGGLRSINIIINREQIIDTSKVTLYYMIVGIDEDWILIDSSITVFEQAIRKSGYYDVQIKAVDEAGNSKIETFEILCDVEGPDVELTIQKEINEETGAITYVAHADIIDDYGYYSYAEVLIFTKEQYDNAVNELGVYYLVYELDELERVDVREYNYDFSDFAAGETYVFLMYVNDEHGNTTVKSWSYYKES